MKKTVTKKRLDRYFDLTERALKKIKISKKDPKTAKDFLNIAKTYYKDAKYFREKGDWVTSFAAVTYAHAWLDAGARTKVFNVKDTELFAAD
jgi:hypothetical protein